MATIHSLSTRRGTSPPRSPRTFCGDHFPWPLIGELSDGDDVAACYILQEKRRAETRANKPYLRLTLGDRTGTIDGYIWDDAERWDPLCVPDDIVGVRGRISIFNDRLQIRVQMLEPLCADDDDMARLLPASERSREQMQRELEALISSVRDAGLCALLRGCLDRETELGRRFRLHPAAKRNHHAFLSGLLEHSLSVAHMCHRLAEHYAIQGVPLDRDLLVTAALLHDIGKVRELRGVATPGYTTEGQLLGHIVLGIQMVAAQARDVPELSEDRLLLLQHLIASHQGKPEWDSPKIPQLLEAMLLHYADDLDAKLNQAARLLGGVPAGEWSSYDRGMGRSFFRPPALPEGDNVETVQQEQAVGLFMDLFHG